MHTTKIAFIGAGNMARAIIAGLITSGHSADHIWASNIHAEKLEIFNQQWGVHTSVDNREVIKHCHVLVLSVKTGVLPTVCSEIKEDIFQYRPLVISVAVGVTDGLLQKWLGMPQPVVRAVPNTPAAVGAAATGLYANPLVTQKQKDLAEAIFRAVGTTVWIDQEQQLDILSAVSGSGPAYFLYIMDAIQEAAIQMGLKPEIARLLTIETGLGTARMALESNQDLKQLRHAVTSPKGTTERGIQILEQARINEIFEKVLYVVRRRAEEIAKDLEEAT